MFHIYRKALRWRREWEVHTAQTIHLLLPSRHLHIDKLLPAPRQCSLRHPAARINHHQDRTTTRRHGAIRYLNNRMRQTYLPEGINTRRHLRTLISHPSSNHNHSRLHPILLANLALQIVARLQLANPYPHVRQTRPKGDQKCLSAQTATINSTLQCKAHPRTNPLRQDRIHLVTVTVLIQKVMDLLWTFTVIKSTLPIGYLKVPGPQSQRRKSPSR